MRVAHFDCFSGISGDMTLAALFDAGVPTEPVLAGIASLGLPIQIEVEKVRKGGFAATQIHVEAPEQDEERHLPDVEQILSRGQLTPRQRELALNIFRRLAHAEAAVHGMPIERVHFHEVGALDSIADIAGAAIALDLLGVDRFTSGSVPTGSGSVKCAHGVMPVPTPATAELLKGVPLRPTTIKSELTTPTGAAILTTIVRDWTDTPAMTVERIGIGAGTKDFREQPNILRLFVGEARDFGSLIDVVWVLETNLDDVPGEVIGYCFERLLAAGALDVFTIPIQMKKQRPGVLLSVLAEADKLPALEDILFQETGTLGVRRYEAQRDKLHREACSVETPWGPVLGKLSWREGRPKQFTPEYEDCARIARAQQRPLLEVFQIVQQAYLVKSR
ncbi:MAG: nickel pincer cofactor biosynthesis protein LarC [Gemmataceae bacterium]|nr:nickel pincer cofactor biosynthesis protein LarC [Gemmataceae bacterium]